MAKPLACWNLCWNILLIGKAELARATPTKDSSIPTSTFIVLRAPIPSSALEIAVTYACQSLCQSLFLLGKKQAQSSCFNQWQWHLQDTFAASSTLIHKAAEKIQGAPINK